MNIAKKAYQTPELKRWGDVAALTKVGQTHPGTDIRSGSVNPPGHVNNPGLGT